MNLNAKVQRQLEDLGMPGELQFKANYNAFKCVRIIKTNIGVNFAKNHSLRTVLGFGQKRVQGHRKNYQTYP